MIRLSHRTEPFVCNEILMIKNRGMTTGLYKNPHFFVKIIIKEKVSTKFNENLL